MSYRIETLLDTNVEYDGKWYIAKPLPYSSWIQRIPDAIRVLKGKSTAVHFEEDDRK